MNLTDAAILQRAVAALDSLVVRRDAYGVEAANGKGVTRRGPITRALLNAHLQGRRRIGAHCLGPDDTVIWSAVDIDSNHLPAGVTAEVH